MTRTMSLLGGVLCLGLAGASGYLSVRSSPPQPTEPLVGVVIEPAGRDFGEVDQEQTLQAEFRVVNHGPGVVTLDEPMKSCSCASVTLDARTLAAGQSCTLAVSWRTGDKVGRVQDMVAV